MNESLRRRRRSATNSVMLGLTGLATLVAIIPLVWILIDVTRQGVAALSLDFFTKEPTPVGVPGGGVANAIVGSLITVGLGGLIAAPIGMLTALFAAWKPNAKRGYVIRFVTDVLAGVPSIVMGIFAYTIIVLPQKHFSAFAGGVVLAFIMLPTIIRTTEEMLKLVPRSLREGSLALGAPEWKSFFSVVLPAAGSGVLTGIMLATARAMGEAAPMLFTAFGNQFMSTSLNEPIATLPHTVYTYAIAPYNDWHEKAWATALVLIGLVLALNLGARGIAGWRARKLGVATR
jgi:phosphate transport system permease protein